MLAARETPEVDLAVSLGVAHRLPARLLARRVRREVAALRRRVRREAKRRGQPVRKTRLALEDWQIFVTNVPAARLSLADALVLARARWQIELLFKLWKSHGRLDEVRSSQPCRVLCEVYAKAIALVLQHWACLLGCWQFPHRSLTKAAQLVRHHALALAIALPSRRRLRAALALLRDGLHAGCRMNRRRANPSTSQLLLDPDLALESLT